ncbi:MAG: hypothetical protein MUC38_06650 [Cyclobacteriaceae bacterium]|jgi:hypothetical protein|nr:hypothetical protein [Cyclobacteriaceae bacterium]
MKRWILVLLLATACGEDDPVPARPYRMGFQNSGPRITLEDFQRSLELWTTRADAAIITTEVPWKELLDGQPAVDYVKNNYGALAERYRSLGFELWVYIDPQNGLDRTSDATELVNRGRSMTEPEIQSIYRRFTLVMDSLLQPEHLGLALETNLMRTAAPPALYQSVKRAANQLASELKARPRSALLSVSIQAEDAWGKLGDGIYKGIDQDFIDFPFIEELGISSYPYFAFNSPADIPANYYARLVEGRTLPRFVSEGGWASATAGPVVSSEEEQAAYLLRHDVLLREGNCSAVFQLLFTDIDIDRWPPPIPENLPLFTSIGLVDVNFRAKPALARWDELFALPRKTP